ncbi:hypothetical protein A33Q_2605 [Indibacter alkaliphilus LW1]|uniref:Uncharacterized protein n=1 Tax=Indibacter alkaliphilus (strain CCUG 57479 / KCTC 22604 / LW1) TaxID=1189612 RepID=S2D9U4_INDAL|nr:hypothetical protein A33Q_2605 [Indibacter alkaliphilus LW1]
MGELAQQEGKVIGEASIKKYRLQGIFEWFLAIKCKKIMV